MSRERNAVMTEGLALGALYLFEAVFSTGPMFLLWPILGGVFAAGLQSWRSPAGLSPQSGAKAGAQAALVAGLVLLIVGTPLTYYVLKQVNEEPGLFGMTFDLAPIINLLILFSVYAAFGLVLAAIAGAVTGLLRGGAAARPR